MKSNIGSDMTEIVFIYTTFEKSREQFVTQLIY